MRPADDLDLSPVRGLTRLLVLRLWGPARVDLSALTGLSLERLVLFRITADPGPLADLPALRRLDLSMRC